MDWWVKMITTSKILLYIAIIVIFGILPVECQVAPSINDISQVTLGSEPPMTVYSIRYDLGSDNIKYVIGHSSFKVPFKDIYILEIYKERDKYYVNITDVNMNKIEKRELKVDYYYTLTGTADDNGIKGDFSANIKDYSRIVIIGKEETTGTDGAPLTNDQDATKLMLIHIVPLPPSNESSKTQEPNCQNGICTKQSPLTPTYLSLMITSNDPFASSEEIPPDNLNSAKKWLYEGNANYNNSSYEKALNSYEEAINLVNKSPTLWYYKGDALYQLHKYNDAVQAYKRATDLAPKFVEAWNNLALSYRELGLNEEAQDALTRLNEIKAWKAIN